MSAVLSLSSLPAPALRLGHLVFGVRKPERWTVFCERMLGLPAPRVNADGSRGYQVDEAVQRLIVQESPADDLVALGLECADELSLQAAVRRLREGGVRVQRAEEALRRARRVDALFTATDPAGTQVELFTGAECAAQPFASEAFASGFCTGELGLGHAVLVSRDLAAMEDFYVGLLGFGVTERLATKAGPIDVRGTFLHCNRRHHSLALFDLPLAKRMHHFMLQARALSDVGLAFERARELKVPLSLDLGQHPAPDSTFSFYGATPSGFDFEIGSGSQEIDPRGWDTMHTGTTSSWGHKPQLRLQLKMAAGLVASRFGRRAPVAQATQAAPQA